MVLKYIEAYLMVIEKGSFSAAADELYITQPTISVRIQQLEKELNSKLFKRVNGKNVTLTPAGEKILPYFKEAFQLIKKGSRLLLEDSKKQTKMILSCPNHMGVEILPELLKVLYAKFPNIDFEVGIGTTDEIIRDVHSGEVDFGFAYCESDKNYPDLTMIQIAEEKNILVCAPDHPLTQKGSLSAIDLKDERIIVYNRDFPATKIIKQYLQNQELGEYKEVEINNLGWIKMMIRKGLGIAFLQKMIVSDELENKKVVELPISEPFPSTPIHLIFKPTIPNDMKETIIQTAKSIFQDF